MHAAEQTFFQQQLTDFTRNYFVLLTQLRAMPEGPVVVVNLYYNAFDAAQDCHAAVGTTEDKVRVLAPAWMR
jgi:hypothetical protein